MINSGSNSSSLSYGAFRNRYKQVAVAAGATETTIYIAGLLEKVTRGSLIEYRHTIHGGQGTAAIHTRRSGGTPASDTVYLHQDHLGSPELLTDAAGAVLLRLSFGAYGERRDGSDWDGAVSSADLTKIGNSSRHGFTGHEHLDAVGLIHMNGRVYDPLAGRFLGVDPILSLGLSQNVNSYSYAWNNPLNVTDPSGFADDDDVTKKQCKDGCFIGSFWDFLGAMGWLDYGEPSIEEKRSWDFSSPSPSPNPVLDTKWDGKGPPVDWRLAMGGTQATSVVGEVNPYLCARAGICTPQPSVSVSINEVADFSAGFGDVALSIITLGSADGVEYRRVNDIGNVDPTSTAYQIGYWGGVLASVGVGRLFASGSAARSTTGVGAYAEESIPARSAGRNFTAAERAETNRIGSQTGCHTCGTTNPGTRSDNFVPDHQPPSALNPTGGPQRLYPQCLSCSREQGLEIARQLQLGGWQ